MKKCFSWKYLKVPVKPVVRKNKTAKNFKHRAIFEKKILAKGVAFLKGWRGGEVLFCKPLGPF